MVVFLKLFMDRYLPSMAFFVGGWVSHDKNMNYLIFDIILKIWFIKLLWKKTSLEDLIPIKYPFNACTRINVS